MNLYKESTKPIDINVLFVGGGRRVSLAKRFIKKSCNIFSYEDDVNYPISEIAKVIPGLKWKNPGIKDHINKVCVDNKIKLIIPLQDEAIPICCGLVAHCPASLNASSICFDKLEFAEKMCHYQEYPLVLYHSKVVSKPRFGFNSKNILITNYESRIIDSNHVVQRYIQGTEYSVDCYFNKNSDLIGYVPRKREVVQGGEVVQSTTIYRDNQLYNKFGEFISMAFEPIGAVGPYCIQFIEKDNNIYIIEANARFGGGVILSLEAGFDIIDLIIQEYIFNQTILVETPSWKEGFSMTRYFSEHFYESYTENF